MNCTRRMENGPGMAPTPNLDSCPRVTRESQANSHQFKDFYINQLLNRRLVQIPEIANQKALKPRKGECRRIKTMNWACNPLSMTSLDWACYFRVNAEPRSLVNPKQSRI